MRTAGWIAAAAFLVPSLVSAAGVLFPAESIWLSNTNPRIGDAVTIYTVVYNAADSALSGDVTFFVDKKQHARKQVSLKAGESTVVSSVWTAAEGEHAFAAEFAGSGTGSAGAIASVSVIAKVDAPPTAVEQTIAQAKDVSTKVASTSIPIVTALANTVLDATESFREAGIEYLEKTVADAPVADAQSESGPKPTVLGTTTVSQVEGFEGDSESQGPGMFATAKHAAASGLLAVFKSFWLFYPILVLLLLIIFRWLYRWATGPRI